MIEDLAGSGRTQRPASFQVALNKERTSAQSAGSGAKPRRNEALVLEGQIDVSHCRYEPYDKPARPERGGVLSPLSPTLWWSKQ
jgi:hypothetical protein